MLREYVNHIVHHVCSDGVQHTYMCGWTIQIRIALLSTGAWSLSQSGHPSVEYMPRWSLPIPYHQIPSNPHPHPIPIAPLPPSRIAPSYHPHPDPISIPTPSHPYPIRSASISHPHPIPVPTQPTLPSPGWNGPLVTPSRPIFCQILSNFLVILSKFQLIFGLIFI